MPRNLPSLNALRYFEIVASHQSIKKAAEITNISESSISRQVRLLEEQLGVELFMRQHNGLAITDTGKRLATGLGEAFDHIERILDPVTLDRDVITIRVVPAFGLRWLMERIGEFNAKYPSIEIMIQTRMNDMMQEDQSADMGVRYGLGPWPQEDAIELYQEWITPVGSPNYLGRGNILKELQQATLLHPHPNRQAWQVWAKKSGLLENAGTGQDFETMDMALSAAEAGHGIAMADTMMAYSSLCKGTLKAPISYAVPTGVSYYLVTKPSLQKRYSVRIFEDWLIKQIKTSRQEVDSLLRDFEHDHTG